MKILYVLIFFVSQSLWSSALLDPFQQELKARVGQPAKKPVTKSPAKVSIPAKKPTAEPERKLKMNGDFAAVAHKFWGDAIQLKQLWDELQQLFKKNKGLMRDAWLVDDKKRLAEIHDTQIMQHSPRLAGFLSAYIIMYDQLDRAEREQLVTLTDYAASALFGNAKIPEQQQATIGNIISSIGDISQQTKDFAHFMNMLLQTSLQKSGGKEAKVAKEKTSATCLAALRKKYLDEFDKNRKELMQIFFDIAKLDDKRWADYIKEIYPAYTKTVADVFGPLKEYPHDGVYYPVVQKLLGLPELAMEPIAMLHGPLKGMLSTESSIILDDVELRALPSEYAREWVILHELYHILYEDPLKKFAMETRLAEDVRKDEFLSLWNYFAETRADVFAALTSKEHALGYLEYFESKPTVSQFINSHSHLHHAQRAAFAMKFLAEMLQCYE